MKAFYGIPGHLPVTIVETEDLEQLEGQLMNEASELGIHHDDFPDALICEPYTDMGARNFDLEAEASELQICEIDEQIKYKQYLVDKHTREGSPGTAKYWERMLDFALMWKLDCALTHHI